MKTVTRRVAAMLVLALLLSLLPTQALAITKQPRNAPESNRNSAYTVMADVVYYNLEKREIAVGTDQKQLDKGEVQDLFEADGSYTIELEENAFFPYEIWFRCDDMTETLWFMNPEDTKLVGGHLFRVHSADGGTGAITQLGVTVNGTYIPAYPEEKNFRSTPNLMRMSSLQPLERHRLSLDLTGFFPSELDHIHIDSLLSGTEISGDSVALWARWGYRDESGDWVFENDDYHKLENGTLNLRNYSTYSNAQTLELVVGTADQLNTENVIYEVRISTYDVPSTLFQAEVVRNGTPREKLDIVSMYLTKNADPTVYSLSISLSSSNIDRRQELLLGLTMNEELYGTLSTKVYPGTYQTEDEIPADTQEITELMNQGSLASSGGYSVYTGDPASVTLVIKRGETTAQVLPLQIYIRSNSYPEFPVVS